MSPFGGGAGGGRKAKTTKSTPGPSGHPRQRWTSHLMSPFGGGQREDGKHKILVAFISSI